MDGSTSRCWPYDQNRLNHVAHNPLHVRRPKAKVFAAWFVRMTPGRQGTSWAPTTRHSFEAIFMHVPGLLVAVDVDARRRQGPAESAIRDENPVIFIEHEYL